MLLPLRQNVQQFGGLVDGDPNTSQTFTTSAFDPPANSRLVAVCRAGRSNHAAAYSWSFTASGGLGAMTVAWSGAEWPSVGNLFARQMAIAYIDVGASPPTGVSVTVDAWGTTDTGAYIVAVLCLTDYNAGAWLAQTPAEDYETVGVTTLTPTLAAATTGQTVVVAVAEDSGLAVTWGAPESGWGLGAYTDEGDYYLGAIYQDPDGDASGSTTITFTPTINNTAQAVIFEVAPAAGAIPLAVAGTIASTGTLTRRPAKAFAGTASSTGTLTRQPSKPLAGTITRLGTLTLRPAKALAGSATSAGALAVTRAILRSFTGTVTSSATVAKVTGRPLAGSATSTGALARRTGKALTGTVTSSATLTLVRAILRSFAGTTSPAGGLTRQAGKPTAGAVTSAGALARQARKALAGTVTSSSTLARAKVALIAFAGAVTPAATLTRRPGKALAGSASTAGVLARRPGKTLAGAVTSSGLLTRVRLALIALAGSLPSGGTVARRTVKTLTGSVTAAGAATRRAGLLFAGSVTSAAAATVVVGGVEAWSWYVARGGLLRKSTPKLDGVHPTTTDVT